MMASKPINLVLFGDQAVEKLSSIRALVRHARTSAAAQRFLQDATYLVQAQLGQLRDEDRDWDHDVHSLLGLAEENAAKAVPSSFVATVLMCIGRLGEVIIHAEEDPSILGTEDDRVEILAFCTGSLPAAALAAANDTSELFALSREIIAITIRMCIALQRRLVMIEQSNQSWATTLVGRAPEQVQPILDQFHEQEHVPSLKRVAVSVVSNGWLTLTGAPSSLRKLMDFSQELNDVPKIETDTKVSHTPYFPSVDMDAILGDSHLLSTPVSSKARILSPSSCKAYSHSTLRALLSDIITDILFNKLLIDSTISACISGIGLGRPVSLILAGPTGHQPAVEKLLKAANVKYEVKQHNLNNWASTRSDSGAIAVVGMAARLPGSDTVEGFFENLMKGKVQLQKIPESRFDVNAFYDPTGTAAHSTSTNQGAFLDRPGHFDNRLFSISPREALQMDPLQRLLLTTSWEALEMAGYSRDATPSTQSNRIATYFGQASNDWCDVLNSDDDIDVYYVPGLSRAFGPGRLAYHHKWGGGTYSLDTACSSSTTAIHLACQALAAHECDTALAGGGSLLVTPMIFAGLSKSGMISDHGGCRTYHDDADGYARGEGVGMVVLKRLDDAVAENDNILGIIRGSGRTYTTTSTSITHPDSQSQVRLYQEIMRQTAVVPNEIAYVEMHGTGTQAGDVEEMKSVIQVLSQQRSKTNILTVGAVKANVGHGEGAAGVTSLIKVLMMMAEKKIPPQPGYPFKLNRNFPNLEASHVRIAGVGSKDLTLRSSPTSRNGKIKCLVSSFDASGGNTALLVEEAPTRPRKAQNLLKCHPITLSAKTPASLQRNQERLLEFLTRFPSTNLADLAYTTSARRMHEVLRVAYAGQTTKDIMISLRESLAKGTASTIKKPKPSCIAFMFTGQGSQYAGMGRQYYAQSSTFRELLQTYQTICEHQGLPRFLHVISDTNADMAHLSTVAAQLAIVALELGITHLFRSWGIEPKLVIGHSLGEYSALCVAGVLSVSDTFHLVGRRAQLMEQKLTANEYSMLAVHESLESTLRLLATDGHALDHTEVACVNAPQITVVSGPAGEIKHLQSALQMQGSKSTILRTSYGFHSRHIHPVLEDLGRIAQSIHFSPPKIPVISTLLGRIVEAGEGDVFSSSYLVRQARERVQFSGALQAYKEHSLAKMQAFWLEVGPEPTCIGLARKSLDASSNRFLCTAKSTEDNWASASQALAALWQSGASVDWPQYYKPFSNTVQLLKIPTYAFDEKSYWKPYVQRSSSNPQHSVELKNNASIASKTSSPAFQTTSLQWIENEVLDGDSISVTFASRTSDTDLYDAIQGHTVNGVAIVSMSMFGDMAKSAARYAYEKLHPAQQPPNMTIEDLDMTHALVVQLPNPDQVVHTSISYTRGSASFVTFSSSTKGDAQKDHGSLRLVFEDTSNWFSQQNQMSFLVNARIHSLKELATKGDAHHLLKPIIYRLFSNLVSYGSHYKAMEEAWVDRQCRDAASTIRLSSSTGNGRFLYNPFWSDGAVHLGGFLLNAGLTDDEDSVSLCTGLGCWRSLHDLRGGETYTTYAAIEESSTPHMLTGSAYVFDSEQKLVQVATGMRFHKMKRITLGAILGTPQATAVPAAQPLTKPSQWLGNTLTIPNLGVLTPASTIGGDDFDRGDYIGNTTFQTQSTSQTDDNMKTFLSIVTSECGCSEAELDQNTLFADIGVDSLMAITIFATFRKQTGIELPVTFFLDHESIAEARAALSGPSPGCSSPTSSESELDEPFTDDPEVKEPNVVIAVTQDDSEGLGVEIDAQEEAELLPGPKEEPVKIAKPSQVVLLNGNPSSKGRKLFLLPDGSGSPGGFIQLPPLDASLNTYAVQSPFSKCPAEYTCTMEEICGSFLEAIKTVQSEGPYMIGGYSFGALYAYEVTRMLCERGEQVHGLFIIDMAVPNHTNTHVDITQQSLTDAGLAPMMGMMTAASKEHQLNTIRAMFPYVPTPCISPTQPRKTVLIFTKDGLTSGKQCELALWAQGNSSPTRGWETLINGPLVRKDVGGTHFALLRYPAVKVLGEVWAEAVASL